MRRLLLVTALVFLCAASVPIRGTSFLDAHLQYTDDVDTLYLLKGYYEGEVDFHELLDGLPYLFVPLYEKAKRSPHGAEQEKYLVYVSVLHQCTYELTENAAQTFPASCAALEEETHPRRLLKESEYEEERNIGN